MDSVWFWLIVAFLVLLLIWLALTRYRAGVPAGTAAPGGMRSRKLRPPDCSGTNAHPPRKAMAAGSSDGAAGGLSRAVGVVSGAAVPAAAAGSEPGGAASSAQSTEQVAEMPAALRSKPVAGPASKPKPKSKSKAKLKANAKAKTQTKSKARTSSAKDELQRISGVGPKIDGQLKAMKVTTFAQIAAWKKADIEKVNEKLKFKGRIEREGWVPQAKLLAAGKESEFARKYGSGGMKDSSGKTKSGTRTRKP